MFKKEINGNFKDIYFSIKSIQTELCSIKERLRNLDKLGLDTDEEMEVLTKNLRNGKWVRVDNERGKRAFNKVTSE